MTGVVGATGGLGGFFLPTLLGSIKGRLGTFGPAFWVLCLFVGTAFAALLRIQRGIKRYRNAASSRPLTSLEPVVIQEEVYAPR